MERTMSVGSHSRYEPPEPSSLTRIYGFVTMLTALGLFTFYLALAITPEQYVVAILGHDIEGVQRIAGTIPVVILLTLAYVIVAYAALDLLSTPALDDYRWISDKYARPWVESAGQTPVIADKPKLLWSRSIVAKSHEEKESLSSTKAE